MLEDFHNSMSRINLPRCDSVTVPLGG